MLSNVTTDIEISPKPNKVKKESTELINLKKSWELNSIFHPNLPLHTPSSGAVSYISLTTITFI